MNRSLPALLVGTLILVTSCSPGQKLLKLKVLTGGQAVLSTLFYVDDSRTVGEIWDATGEKPFATEENTLRPGSENPLEVKLTGSVVILIEHANRLTSRATLDGVTLQRSSATSDDWHLPAEDVARAKKAAGI